MKNNENSCNDTTKVMSRVMTLIQFYTTTPRVLTVKDKVNDWEFELIWDRVYSDSDGDYTSALTEISARKNGKTLCTESNESGLSVEQVNLLAKRLF